MLDSVLLHPRRAFIILTLASSLLLQSALAAPAAANFATHQEQQQEQEQSLAERGLYLSRTRQLAVDNSSSPIVSSSAEDVESATSLPTSSEDDSNASASTIQLTRSSPTRDIASSSESSASSSQDVTSSLSSSSSFSSSSSSSSEPTFTSTSASSRSTSSSSSTSTTSSASSTSSSTASASSSSLSSSSAAASASDTTSPIASSSSPSSSSSASSSTSVSLTPSSIASTLASSSPASTSTSNIGSTSSSSVFPSASAGGKAMAACSCGYKLSKFNDLYLRKRYSIDFRKHSTVSQLTDAGMFIADGYQIGNTAPDGTSVYASRSNIKLASDGVYMVVPGGQAAGGQVTGAQMIFNNNGKGMTRMWAEAHIQVDATPGTCQAFWTYTVDQSKTSDEQDMEVIAASLLEPSEVKEAGLQLTNHAPDGAKDHRTIPFPTDPSVGFHKYTIAWDRETVQYSFDEQLLDGPTTCVSQNPSNLVFNNWGSGDIGFMGAPLPATDVTMRIKAVTVYYETDFDSSLPSGCTESQVCVV